MGRSRSCESAYGARSVPQREPEGQSGPLAMATVPPALVKGVSKHRSTYLDQPALAMPIVPGK